MKPAGLKQTVIVTVDDFPVTLNADAACSALARHFHGRAAHYYGGEGHNGHWVRIRHARPSEVTAALEEIAKTLAQ